MNHLTYFIHPTHSRSFLLTFLPQMWLGLFGQSYDLRNASTYHESSHLLKTKVSYYYDSWSESEIRHGRFNQWDTKGMLVLEAHYFEGKLHGKLLSYGKKGHLARTEHWSHGQKHGNFLHFSHQGITLLSAHYFHDQLEGELKLFRKNGSLKQVEHYHRGMLHGEKCTYDRQGNIIRQHFYQHGKRQKFVSTHPPKA